MKLVWILAGILVAVPVAVACQEKAPPGVVTEAPVESPLLPAEKPARLRAIKGLEFGMTVSEVKDRVPELVRDKRSQKRPTQVHHGNTSLDIPGDVFATDTTLGEYQVKCTFWFLAQDTLSRVSCRLVELPTLALREEAVEKIRNTLVRRYGPPTKNSRWRWKRDGVYTLELTSSGTIDHRWQRDVDVREEWEIRVLRVERDRLTKLEEEHRRKGGASDRSLEDDL